MVTKTTHDKNAYTRLKNHLRDLTRYLRGVFEHKIAANVKFKPKRFWKYTRSRLKSRQGIPTLTKPDGSKATNPKDKAETLNQFFASVFTSEYLDNIPVVDSIPDVEVLLPLSISFGKSLKEGAHKSWLKAIITAIHKKGPKS